MRNAKQLLAALTVILMIAAGCGSKPKTVNVDELDLAIRDASNYLNENIPKGSKIVILNIQSSSPDLSDYIIDELIANAVMDKFFSVVDRQQLDAIRAEQNFQWSGEVDDNAALEIGKFFGAQSIVSGGVNRLGNGYRIRIRALEVQTAQVQGQYNRNIASSQLIATIIGSGSSGTSTASASAPSTGTTARTGGVQAVPVQAAPAAPATPTAPVTPAQPTPPAPATPVPTVYKIGDTGPAGGIIFYDKGNNDGDWQYLEAAPAGAEFQASWSVRGTTVENTRSEIGSGKMNTQLIVEKFKQTSGEWDTAAQKANDLVLRGFDDWFLPSKDELDQMYGNLKRRNLGGFKNDRYWSSTQYGGSFYHLIHIQGFGDGRMDSGQKYVQYFVRPIRQF